MFLTLSALRHSRSLSHPDEHNAIDILLRLEFDAMEPDVTGQVE